MPNKTEDQNQTLKPIGLFHTPENWAYIEDWIERHNQEDRGHLWTVAGMTWNLAAKLAQRETEVKPAGHDILIAELIQHYFAEINNYSELTNSERQRISREDYHNLQAFIKETLHAQD